MRNTNLADETGRIYYNIQRNDGVNICQVYGKNNAKSLIDELNGLHEENIILKSELSFSQNQNRELRKVLEDNRSMVEVVEENKLLKKEI